MTRRKVVVPVNPYMGQSREELDLALIRAEERAASMEQVWRDRHAEAIARRDAAQADAEAVTQERGDLMSRTIAIRQAIIAAKAAQEGAGR